MLRNSTNRTVQWSTSGGHDLRLGRASVYCTPGHGAGVHVGYVRGTIRGWWVVLRDRRGRVILYIWVSVQCTLHIAH